MEKVLLVCSECLALGNSCKSEGCFCIRHVEISAKLNQTLEKEVRMNLDEVLAFVDRCEEWGCQFSQIARSRVGELREFFETE